MFGILGYLILIILQKLENTPVVYEVVISSVFLRISAMQKLDRYTDRRFLEPARPSHL